MPRKSVLVIGNGFDLDLGLSTKYSDFAKSDEWISIYEHYAPLSKYYSLLKYLNDRKDYDNWFDIEQALFDYASAKAESPWKHDVETDKREYQAICKALSDYLDNQVKTSKHDILEKTSRRVLQLFQYEKDCRKIYTFNYTSLELIARVGLVDHLVPFVHVHGSIDNKNIILGFNISSPSQIIPGYSFMVKTDNPFFQSIQLEQDLIDADEVIIFGHSLNMMDSVYFESYLKFLSEELKTDKTLTIITYDEKSRQNILNNMRQIGIVVPKLFSRGRIEFIQTSNLENDRTMKDKFESLLKRMNIY